MIVDALDYKTLNALFNIYRERVIVEEALISTRGSENAPIDEMTIAAHTKAYYDMKLIQLINKFKGHRQRLREDYLQQKT